MYSNKYLKIYFWKILRLIIGSLSFLIVIPKIGTDQNIYGVYTFCVSLTIFFQYADIGFLDAGQKFAADFYVKKDLKNEIKIFSFIYFIMFIGVIFFSLFLLTIIYRPHYFINNITSANSQLLKSLLIILIVFSPTVILQRFCQSVFTIRIEDYIYHSIDLFFNLLKVLSVFCFFNNKTNNLLMYFIFIQIMNFLSALSCLIIIKKRFNYDFRLLITSFKFSKDTFNKVKHLSFSSFVATICWVLFFYIDNIIIAKLTSVSYLAIFSIGISIITLLIGLINTVFSPFLFRFNELIINNDKFNFDKALNIIIRTLIPVIVISLFIIFLFTDKIILGWLGQAYNGSIQITRILITSLIWFSFSVPFNYILISKQRINKIYTSSIILPFLFFLIILLTLPKNNAMYVAIAKSISLLIYSIYVIFSCKFYVDKKIYSNLLKTFFRLSIFFLIISTLYYYFNDILPIVITKNRLNFLILILSIFLLNLIIIISYFISDKHSKTLFYSIIKNLRN